VRSASDFRVFERWREAPSFAFGAKDGESIVPEEDKEAYWRIYEELKEAVEVACELSSGAGNLLVRPKQYSKERGSRGHRPLDLWVSTCSLNSESFGFMPQVYVIASERGLETGFAVSIPEDDYFDADVKARNRSIVPFINQKLPLETSVVSADLAAQLSEQGGWHFNTKTRLISGHPGYDKFSTAAELFAWLRSEGASTGGGAICRTFPIEELETIDLAEQFLLGLDNFLPILSLCAPTSWDAQIRAAQMEAEIAAEQVPFDPQGLIDGRIKVLAEVARRQGQASFRAALMEAYEGRCAITGTSVVDVLQAAHITPYLGPATNHVSNGLLLRADVHTLFDLALIRIHPESLRVSVSPVLSDTDYWSLDGKHISLPRRPRLQPSRLAIAKHFNGRTEVEPQVASQRGDGSNVAQSEISTGS
jgi:hypothetical protein